MCISCCCVLIGCVQIKPDSKMISEDTGAFVESQATLKKFEPPRAGQRAAGAGPQGYSQVLSLSVCDTIALPRCRMLLLAAVTVTVTAVGLQVCWLLHCRQPSLHGGCGLCVSGAVDPGGGVPDQAPAWARPHTAGYQVSHVPV
jgi:hypothetical protein